MFGKTLLPLTLALSLSVAAIGQTMSSDKDMKMGAMKHAAMAKHPKAMSKAHKMHGHMAMHKKMHGMMAKKKDAKMAR